MMNKSDCSTLHIREDGDSITFLVHVQPRASKNELCGVVNDAVRLRLTSPPVEDAANKLCVTFLAGLLGVAKSNVSIVAGAHSRHKTVRARGVTARELLELLARVA